MRKILLTLALLAVATAPALASHYGYGRQQLIVNRIVTPFVPTVAVQAIVAPVHAPLVVAPVVAPSCYTAPAVVAPQVKTEQVVTQTVVAQPVVAASTYGVSPIVAGYRSPFAAIVAHSAAFVQSHHAGIQRVVAVRGGARQIVLAQRAGRPVLFPRIATRSLAPRLRFGVVAPRAQLRK